MERKLRIPKQNRGFSLVELIIAIAILVIVTGAVCSFIVVTSRNYANGNNDISVQQEAQLAFDQISDVLIDARSSINYAGDDGSGSFVKVLKDAEFANEPTVKKLIVYNTVSDQENEENTESYALSEEGSPTTSPDISAIENYVFMWQKSDENLYFATWKQGEEEPVSGDQFELLAEHIVDFQVDLSQMEERRVVKLKMNFMVGNRKFEMANNLTVRNEVVINEADIKPLDKSVSVKVELRENPLVLEPGEEYTFQELKIKEVNVLKETIEWSFITDDMNSETTETDGGSRFVTENGGRSCKLIVGVNEKAEKLKICVTLTGENGEKIQTSKDTSLSIDIKRVKQVILSKANQTTSEEGRTIDALEVMQGSTVVINGNVSGRKNDESDKNGKDLLGMKCDSCKEDTTRDKYLTDWTVISGAELLEDGIKNSDYESATIQIKDEAAVGSTITIQATSELSKRKKYADVTGTITLTVVKSNTKHNPFSGILRHGDQTRVDDIMYQGFERGVGSHVLAIHIVDNETSQLVDYVVCKASGWNVWVSPDYFDLDLKKSYTFYLQALECVSKQEHERYDKEHGSFRISSNDEIREEYEAHTAGTAPFAYTGDKFKSSPVYSTILEPAQLTYGYNNKKYCAEEINFKSTNVLAVKEYPSDGVNILNGLQFHRDETQNIDLNAFTVDDVKYSIYKGEGNDPANWTPLYVFNGGDYAGGTSLYNGNVQLGTASSLPTIKVKRNNLSDVVGTYHIVPGIWFDPTIKIGNMPQEIIAPAGYQFPVRTAKKKYVEFAENTFHVTVTAEGTMDIKSDRFTGSVCFPLPPEMPKDIYIGLEQTEWQEANIQNKDSGVEYNTIDSNNNISKIKFNRIRYRYIQSENAYEVEPMWETTKTGGLKITYSYGVYKCAVNGSKWQCIEAAKKTNNVTFEFDKDGSTWSAHVPLPTDDDFMFTKESTQRQVKNDYTIVGYRRETYNENKNLDVKLLYCDYDQMTKQYKLSLVENERIEGIYKITQIMSVYGWKPEDSKWYKQEGQSTIKNSIANIGITWNGKSYIAYLPDPGNKEYWNSNEISWPKIEWYLENDQSASTKMEIENLISIKRTYDEEQKKYTIELIQRRYWPDDGYYVIARYQCPEKGTTWTQVN